MSTLEDFLNRWGQDSKSSGALGFYIFTEFLHTCGVKATLEANGSATMTQSVWTDIKLAVDALSYMPKKPANFVVDYILKKRAESQLLAMNTKEDLCIVRLASMCGVRDPIGANAVTEAVQSLDEGDQALLLSK